MSELISEIVDIAETERALYLLLVEYEQGDGGNGVGHVHRTDGHRNTVLEGVLSTNDTLRAMWVSPSGAIWLTSEGGNVWTSAGVQWPRPKDPDLDFKSYDAALRWNVTTLPNLEKEGYSPNLGVIWGTDDANVFAAAFGGHIYYWNGKTWRQIYTAAGTIRAFSGTSAQNILAVGENSTLLHFNGTTWRDLHNPDDSTDYHLFTGACYASDGSVYICSQGGTVLHGSASGLTVLVQNDDIQLMGLVFLGDRLLFAAGSKGVAEFTNSTIVVIRSTFDAVFVKAGKRRSFFLEGASTETGYIEYDPENKKAPWWGITF